MIRLCTVLGVSSSGYYSWIDCPLSQREKDYRRLTYKFHCFHKASYEIYGFPKLYKELLDDGEQVGINRVAGLMRNAGIKARTAALCHYLPLKEHATASIWSGGVCLNIKSRYTSSTL